MNKRTLAVAGASVLCAGGVAFAATASAIGNGASPASSSAPASAQDTTERAQHTAQGSPQDSAPGDSVRDAAKLPRLLHTESVMQDPDTGKLTTHDVQSGAVTSVSGSSVTVRSTDGTEWVWTLTGDTRIATQKNAHAAASDVKTGDSVLVAGTRDGDTRTARRLSDPPRALAQDVRRNVRQWAQKHLGNLKDLKDLKDLRKQLREEFGRPSQG